MWLHSLVVEYRIHQFEGTVRFPGWSHIPLPRRSILAGRPRFYSSWIQGEPKKPYFCIFFGEKFSKITYKGYFHAIFENFSPKKRKSTVFLAHPVLLVTVFGVEHSLLWGHGFLSSFLTIFEKLFKKCLS